jgi:hypothetical protein
MAHAYTPGLRVTALARIERVRRLPLKGTVLVQRGAALRAEDVVARTQLPGNVQTVKAASLLGIHQEDLREYMIKKEGDAVAKDEPIATSKSFFGLFKAECRSPIEGTVEAVSTVTGQVILREPPIPVEVNAYVDGRVADVLPDEGVVMVSAGAFLQGIFGIGGETSGVLHAIVDGPNEVVTAAHIKGDVAGKVLIGGSHVTHDVLRRAVEAGARAIVVGGFSDSDLKAFLGYDLGVAITGQEGKGISLVVTEGFGKMPMAEKTFRLLRERVGARASVNGATQIRAGVMRPEIIVPDPTVSPESVPEGAAEFAQGLRVGSPVRAIRDPWFGRIGVVTGLPPELRPLETEASVRVLSVRFDGDAEVTMPRANVEMIEE